ncbi:MAG TPA: VanZ family protein [Clostridiales bacterium]|nr:VanZ family protein [Clostridiales bacterium]
MKRKLLPWIFVILWMTLIFFLSHQPAMESNQLSSGIIKRIYDIIKMIAPDIRLDLESLNHIIRKLAHFGVYMILGFLLANGLRYNKKSRINAILLALLICILYAISDEIHQIFIPGRSGQVSDVLIDSLGGLVGIVLLDLLRRRKRREVYQTKV